jgi:hypothetical protein
VELRCGCTPIRQRGETGSKVTGKPGTPYYEHHAIFMAAAGSDGRPHPNDETRPPNSSHLNTTGYQFNWDAVLRRLTGERAGQRDARRRARFIKAWPEGWRMGPARAGEVERAAGEHGGAEVDRAPGEHGTAKVDRAAEADLAA